MIEIFDDQGEVSARWEIWLDEPNGNRLVLLDEALSFSFTKVVNNIGSFDLTLPPIYDDYLRLDGMLEFWRAPKNKALRQVGVGLFRDVDYRDLSDGTEITAISGSDGKDLLKRRIVAYPAGSSYSLKSDYADDMLKAIIRENLGSLVTDPARDLSGFSFIVQGDISAGPSTTKEFAWQQILKVIREIVDDSAEQGTDLYFDVLPKLIGANQIGFEFRTYIGQIGRDHTGVDQVIFGKDWGNLTNPSYKEITSSEINYIYAGGQAEEADREIVEVEDAARSGGSIWNRRESFVDARSEGSTASVTSKANTALQKGKPSKIFSADLLDTPRTIYGIDWEFGDRVIAEYRGKQFEGEILAVTFEMPERGSENIKARLEVSL